MAIEVERVEDHASARLWHSVLEESVPLDHPGLVADPLEEVLALISETSASEEIEYYVALEGGKAVGAARLKLPMAGNLHAADLELVVSPLARRRGVGSELFGVIRSRIVSLGRRTIMSMAGGPPGVYPPGLGFARSLGASEALARVRSELILHEIDGERMQGLAVDGAERSNEFELVQWIDHAPHHLVDDWARLNALMDRDSPRGELEYSEERWDAARCRDWEAQTIARGRARILTGAVEQRTGRLVAITDLSVFRERPQIANQWATVVAREFRGKRLGIRVKIANMLQLQVAYPNAARISTWSARENSSMKAINQALGFRAAEEYVSFQLNVG